MLVNENYYVTCEQCSEYRHAMLKANGEQDVVLASLTTDVSYLKKFMWATLTVLISGFAGTIFSVLSLR